MLNEIPEMKSKRNIDGLLSLIRNDKSQSEKDWMLRLDAAEALAQLGDNRGTQFIIKMTESPDLEISDVAKEILEGLKNYQADPVLKTQIANQSESDDFAIKINAKYPYLTGWTAFVVIYLLILSVLVLIPISSLVLFFLQLVIGFFIFKFVTKKLVLPYEKKQ